MNLRQPVTPRMALTVILVIIYAIAMVALVVLARREAGLVRQVAQAEAAAAQMSNDVQNSGPALQKTLADAKARQAELQSRVPTQVQAGFFERVALDAQSNAISDFRYQRKNEYQETLQAGVYKVSRFTIAGRGSADRLAAFLDGLQQGSGQTMLVENVALTEAGSEWQMTAEILVYTWGG